MKPGKELSRQNSKACVAMDESSALIGGSGADKQNTDVFLSAGQLYIFNPQPHFSRLTLCKTRSTNEPGVYIKRKTVLAVVQRINTWRYVYCSGFSGWINVADDQMDAGIFVYKETVRRHEDWKGNNLFFADGRIMIGTDGTAFTVTNVMAGLVTYLFFWHVAPHAPYATIHTAIGSVLIGTAMLNLWLTAFLEPGIIPRQPMHVPPRSPNPITEPGWKYCTICNILRAPQVKHCTPCQVCVVGFDHHCPYTSNCIGARNRKYFVRFVILTTVTIMYVLALGCTILTIALRTQNTGSRARDLEQMLVQQGVVAVVTLAAFLSLFILIPFCHYHLYIVAIGETTFERVKRMYATQPNPHDRGVCGNYAQLCCEKAPDSLLPDLSEEITYEQYLKENVEPEKLSQILYGAGYGSGVTEISPKTLAGTEVV